MIDWDLVICVTWPCDRVCVSRTHFSTRLVQVRDDVTFEDRVIRNCLKNTYEGWGEPGRLKLKDWVARVSGFSRVGRMIIWKAEITGPSLRETLWISNGTGPMRSRCQHLSETKYRKRRGEKDRQIGGLSGWETQMSMGSKEVRDGFLNEQIPV